MIHLWFFKQFKNVKKKEKLYVFGKDEQTIHRANKLFNFKTYLNVFGLNTSAGHGSNGGSEWLKLPLCGGQSKFWKSYPCRWSSPKPSKYPWINKSKYSNPHFSKGVPLCGVSPKGKTTFTLFLNVLWRNPFEFNLSLRCGGWPNLRQWNFTAETEF